MILEGLISTLDAQGRPHISAIGPEVDTAVTRIELRPFQSSHSFQNLQRTRQAVFHVTDDVEAIAAAVCGKPFPCSAFQRATSVDGYILVNACRAYELEISYQDLTAPRATIACHIVRTHRLRDFFGFNRAKHAVVEAAILATRVGFLPQTEIESKWIWLQTITNKTGGPAELAAFAQLTEFVDKALKAAVT